MCKVSVIVPIYNVESYLTQCLDSLVNQTLTDIEIICINDASSDNSPKLLNEYSQKDNRIKIINFKKNKGASIARNVALDEARGEYIGFVDADDFVDLDFYEKLYEKAKKTKGNLVLGNLRKPNTKINFSLFFSDLKANKTNFFVYFPIAIYNNSFLKKHKIKFLNNCCYGEDRLLPIKSAFYADSLLFVENTFYNCSIREDSVTSTQITLKKIESLKLSIASTIDFINSVDISNENYNIIFNDCISQVVSHFLKGNKNIKNLMLEFLDQIYRLAKYNDEFLNDIFNYIKLYYNKDNNFDYLSEKFKNYLAKKQIAKLRNYHMNKA